MTKIISVFIVVALLFCAWQGYKYWEKVKKEEDLKAAASVIQPDSLSGLPSELYHSYSNVKDKGPAVMRKWLEVYGHLIKDPRKAWIELDFCTAIARENPAEARAIFADVKARTPESSPVWPRIKQLEGSFE